MSSTTTSLSSSPSVELEVQSSLPPVQPQPETKTPERKSGASRPIPNVTPPSRGSSVHQSQESDTDWAEEFNWADYDNYIYEDFKSRVFVDFEVFMEHVLHVPDDWRTVWGPAIEAVKADSDFKSHHREYCNNRDESGSRETFYGPLMTAVNAVQEVASRFMFGDISPEISYPYYILGDYPYKSALCEGMNMPRLIVDEVDPIVNHAPPQKPSQQSAKSTPLTMSIAASGPTSGSSGSRKRPADGSYTADRPARKKLRTESASCCTLDESASTEEDEGSSTSEHETRRQVKSTVKICSHLAEMFSTSLLRSHATVSQVDRNRLQLYHANRSVILVSSAINFSEGDGLSKFIAIVIAFNLLSLKQDRIMDSLATKNGDLVKDSGIPMENKVVQIGNQLVFPGDQPDERFTVDLGDTITRDPAAVGRSTVVLNATSERWPESELVVKIGWPDSGRSREMDFLEKANEEAEKTDGKWATKHLPRIFHATDVIFDENSVLESVARLFKDAKFTNGEHVYEQRTLRVIVQERLYPLGSLTNVRDFGQVFLDVACIHRWLFDCPGILHCDLSPYNIMWRLVKEMNAKGDLEQKVYGVLIDFDISSWKEDLENCSNGTSQQHMGSLPYMAYELLTGMSTTRLYRHDFESLFCVMLLVAARYTLVPANGDSNAGGNFQMVRREGTRPYQRWFDTQDYETLGCIKNSFFRNRGAIELSPAFEDFRPWLKDLRLCLSKGFKYKICHPSNEGKRPSWRRKAEGSASGVTPFPVPFDNETLGGHVDYSSIVQSTRYLKGELGGLVVRYETPLPPVPAPTSAV